MSYGSESVLEPFFESLRKATNCVPVILLADNKVTPGSRVEAIALEYGAQYLPMSSNRGYGGAINAAAKILPAEVEWILITNPDVTFEAGAVDTLMARGDSDPRIGALGPRILTATGDVYPSARAIPSLRNGIGHALLAGVWAANPWSAAYRNASNPTRRVGWLSGACLLVRRTVFDKVGGFDAEFFMYFEDVDLGYRLSRLGFANVYEPAAVVTHTGAHSTATDAADMLTAHHESAKRFLSKKYSGALLWPVRTALSAGLNLRSWMLDRKNRANRQ
ncbi:glycosyltransferase family 2 protein [Cryobacterium fucosi]|uniref:glycosyltransferase family 2 protein n=1 Tax=Cryobacterium fucosi TaxID=1259157 RepID=UPI00141B04CD|nr:glycosyltransferase family 2 protein [Cryobacterium fucosi]